MQWSLNKGTSFNFTTALVILNTVVGCTLETMHIHRLISNDKGTYFSSPTTINISIHVSILKYDVIIPRKYSTRIHERNHK